MKYGYTKQRNRQILESYNANKDYVVLANEYHLSLGLIQRIVKDELRKNREAVESQALLKDIQQANDLDRPFNRNAILTAINYPLRVRHLLDKQFYPDAPEITLRQLMDWCSPVITNDSKELYDWVPVFRLKGWGNFTVGDLIRYIDRMDFGQAFNDEWRKRRKAFEDKFIKPRAKRGLFDRG